VKRFLVRFIGTPIFILIFLFILYKGDYEHLVVLIAILSTVCAWEFYSIVKLRGYFPASDVATVLVGINILWLLTKNDFPIATILIVIYVIAKLVKNRKFSIPDAALTIVGFLYVGLLKNGLLLISEQDGKNLILYILATNKGSDIMAYCSGKILGGPKLAKMISPNKTIAGAIGGFCGGLGMGILVLTYTSLWGDFTPSSLLVLTGIVVIAGQVGDLVESSIKRWAGVKDSSNLLVEFGGILDIMDSFLISVPVFVLGLKLL
jgi:phosphatidate cytidylyltransferase